MNSSKPELPNNVQHRLPTMKLELVFIDGELFLLPRCSSCEELITDFSEGIVALIVDFDTETKTVGRLPDGRGIKQCPHRVYVLHRNACDVLRGHSMWVPLDCVLKQDQRRECEKQFEHEVAG